MGYWGMDIRALFSRVHVFDTGSKISGISTKTDSLFSDPDSTIARPSPRAVNVGYHRLKDMDGTDVELSVIVLKVFASSRPRMAPSCPPATSTLPSGRCTFAEQKMLENGFGAGVIRLVFGSHTSP